MGQKHDLNFKKVSPLKDLSAEKQKVLHLAIKSA
jgi:hypothetical protein